MAAISTPSAAVSLPALARWARVGWLVLFALGFTLYILRQATDGPFGKDFTIFLTGAHIVAGGGAFGLYDLGVQAAVQPALAGGYTFPGGVLPFNYPAYVAFFFLPLAYLPPDAAYYVWLGAQWLLFVGLIAWVTRSFREWGFEGGAPGVLPFALLSFQPALEALLMGQMSLVTVALWWWTLLSWRSERWNHLGVAVALSAFKPQMAALLVVALLAQKRWRALGVALATQCALWLGAVLIGGPQVFLGYLDVLRISASTVGTLGFYPAAMPNVRGLLTLLGLPDGIVTIIALLGWLLSLAATFLLWRRGLSLAAKFGLSAVLAVLFSPHLYMHDASLLLLATVCALLSAPSAEAATQRLNRLLLPFALLTISIYAVVLQLI
ncbi:MAG: glycosyltransferase family 87 protein, partial [Chloroflexia bacterium]